MTISVSVQWNSHYVPALQSALWTSAQRPRFRKQWLEPSWDIKRVSSSSFSTVFTPGPTFPQQSSPALVYTCGLIKYFNFKWETKLSWGEREQGSKHRQVCHTFGLLSPKMFRLNKDEFIDSVTPMKQTEESTMKQSKSRLRELNKRKMPTAEGGSWSHSAARS